MQGIVTTGMVAQGQGFCLAHCPALSQSQVQGRLCKWTLNEGVNIPGPGAGSAELAGACNLSNASR